MMKRNTAWAFAVMGCVVGMGCHPQRESKGDEWRWEVRFLDGSLPPSGVAEVWSIGAASESGWAIESGALLGSVMLHEGRGEWPASEQPVAINLRAEHPNGSTQSRSGIRIDGKESQVIELPTPTQLALHIVRPRLVGGRLHARLSEGMGEPDLSTWLDDPPSSATAVMAPHAAPRPLLLEFEFPVGVDRWPVHVQWYWQPNSGGIEPLRTEVFDISRAQAGSTVAVQSSI